MQEIPRKECLELLDFWRDKRVIKVITGVRRCGKSTLMLQYINRLQGQGIAEDCLQYINLEDLSNESLTDYHILYNHIVSQLVPNTRNYVFLDEIQFTSQFQKAVDSLFLKPNVDIYITGSNAYLLSGELATLLSGRYVEIHVQPLSFSEYFNALSLTPERAYAQYVTNSSFPYTLSLANRDACTQYLYGLYQTIVVKDIVARTHIRDTDLLNRITRFLSDNIGNLTTTNKISTTLTSGGKNPSNHTVSEYLEQLTQSYLFYRVERYDVKGREILSTGNKYYLSDVGMRNMLLGLHGGDLGHLLENVIFLELQHRGGQVMIGKSGSQEIDFVSIHNSRVAYYQVALTVRDENTLRRELAPLANLRDNYEKYLLTLDPDPEISHDGIRQIYALDWLLNKE